MLLITTEYPRVISFLEIFIKIRNKNIIFFKLILTRCIPLAIPFREKKIQKSRGSRTSHVVDVFSIRQSRWSGSF